MPRRPNNQIQIRCNTCKNYTQCIEPVDILKNQEIDFILKRYV